MSFNLHFSLIDQTTYPTPNTGEFPPGQYCQSPIVDWGNGGPLPMESPSNLITNHVISPSVFPEKNALKSSNKNTTTNLNNTTNRNPMNPQKISKNHQNHIPFIVLMAISSWPPVGLWRSLISTRSTRATALFR